MRFLFKLLSLMPLRALHALGAFAGTLLWIIPNSRKRISLRNIELCWPQLTREQQHALSRASLKHEMKSVLESPFFWLGNKQRMLDSIRQSEGEEHLDAALKRGKGVMLLTLHLGGWEAAGHAYAIKHPITGLYKPQGGELERLGLEGRSRTGAVMVATVGGSVRQQMTPVLQRNEAVYFLPDQDPPEGRGVFAPFFGVSAHSPTLVSKLAQETGCAVIFMVSERLPHGAGFLSHYFEADPAIYDRDLVTSVTALNAGIERAIRLCPEQYWWGYKRFRRRPPGVAPAYG